MNAGRTHLATENNTDSFSGTAWNKQFRFFNTGIPSNSYCQFSVDNLWNRKRNTEKGQKKVRDFVEYCANHWSAIVVRMSKETCGNCTEPQVSHVLSDRLSRNPIAWSKDGLNRMTMLVVYTKNGGKVSAEDVRIRLNELAKAGFHEDGYARYSDYAKKQSDEISFSLQRKQIRLTGEASAPI